MSKDIKMIGQMDSTGYEIVNRVYDKNYVSPTILTPSGGGHIPKSIRPFRSRRTERASVEQENDNRNTDRNGL